jgi:hypothetical protein
VIGFPAITKELLVLVVDLSVVGGLVADAVLVGVHWW